MKRVLLISVIVSALVACESSGDTDNKATIADFPTVSIQAANSEQVASVVTTAILDGFATNGPDMVFGVDTTSKITVQDFVNTDNLQSFLELVSSLPPIDTVTGISRSEKVTCEKSGSMTIKTFAASSSFITKGDYIKTQMNKCDQGYGVRSGSLTITFLEDNLSNQLTGFGEYKTSIQLTFNQLSLSQEAVSAVGDGVFTLYIESDYGSHISVVSTEAFSIQTMANGHMQLLSNFNSMTQTFYNFGEMRMQSSGTIGDSELEGKISFNLDTPLDFYSEGAAPYAGKIKISGENSILWLTAHSANNVLLELDTNADGTINSSETLNWSELY